MAFLNEEFKNRIIISYYTMLFQQNAHQKDGAFFFGGRLEAAATKPSCLAVVFPLVTRPSEFILFICLEN